MTPVPMIHEWKEPLPGGGVMNWRMEEKENGDQHFTMSADIRIAIVPLPAGDPNAEPCVYTYIPPWPIDPNAPIVADEDVWDEEY
jgi:hypothetical protein